MQKRTGKFLVFICCLFCHAFAFAQLITAPNQWNNNKKQGLWQEMAFIHYTDINGDTHLLYGQHGAPLQGITEGYYENGIRTGVWKTYRIEIFLDSGLSRYRKGTLHSITNADENNSIRFHFDFYTNGNTKLIAQYRKVNIATTTCFSLIDPESNTTKDTCIESPGELIKTGNWYLFDSTGTLIKHINYNTTINPGATAEKRPADQARKTYIGQPIAIPPTTNKIMHS